MRHIVFPEFGSTPTLFASLTLWDVDEIEYTHGKDIPETPVVVLLCRELFLAGVVQNEELLGQNVELCVAH